MLFNFPHLGVLYIHIYMGDILSLLERSARAAGATALSYFHHESHITHKSSHQNLVTIVDTKSQALIQQTIITGLVQSGVSQDDIGFIGEENLETNQAKHMFVIDPLDGTGNFASGLDYFSVSIAHFENNVVTTGVVYWPSRHILYFAEKGKGAFKKVGNKSPVRLQVTDELLKNSLVLMYLSAIPQYFEKTAWAIEQLAPHIRGIRLYGSTCLDVAHVADNENAAHLLVNSHMYIWDIAAAALILEEAGGVCYDFDGKRLIFDLASGMREYSAIAGHPHIVKACTDILCSHKK